MNSSENPSSTKHWNPFTSMASTECEKSPPPPIGFNIADLDAVQKNHGPENETAGADLQQNRGNGGHCLENLVNEILEQKQDEAQQSQIDEKQKGM